MRGGRGREALACVMCRWMGIGEGVGDVDGRVAAERSRVTADERRKAKHNAEDEPQ